MRRGVAMATLGMLMLVAAGCGSSYGGSGGKSTTTQASSSGGGQKAIAGVKANDHGTKAAAASGKTEVELDDFYFEPTVLTGKPGQKVTLELKNMGSTEHSFTIDSQNVDKVIAPGEQAEVVVTIPKSGAVSFYCKFHKSEGMAGALAVEGQGAGGSMPGSGGTTTNNTTTGSYKGY